MENTLFLFRRTDTPPPLESAQFTAGFQIADGEWCAGFDAATLAKGFGIEIDELFEANRSGTLVLAAVEDVAPQFGGAAAKRYVFTLGNKLSMLTIEALQSGGNAQLIMPDNENLSAPKPLRWTRGRLRDSRAVRPAITSDGPTI